MKSIKLRVHRPDIRAIRRAARAWIGAHPDTVVYWLESDPDE